MEDDGYYVLYRDKIIDKYVVVTRTHYEHLCCATNVWSQTTHPVDYGGDYETLFAKSRKLNKLVERVV